MKNNRVINKKEVDIEMLLATKFDDSNKGYYLGIESAGDAHLVFIDCSVKVDNFNSVSLGTPGQGKKFRIENYDEDTEILLKSIAEQSLQTPIVIDFCKNAGNITDGVYIGRVDTNSPVIIIDYIKDDRRFMSIGTLGEGRVAK